MVKFKDFHDRFVCFWGIGYFQPQMRDYISWAYNYEAYVLNEFIHFDGCALSSRHFTFSCIKPTRFSYPIYYHVLKLNLCYFWFYLIYKMFVYYIHTSYHIETILTFHSCIIYNILVWQNYPCNASHMNDHAHHSTYNWSCQIFVMILSYL